MEYGPLTKSSSFTLGNFSVKNFWKARASATGSGVSAAAAGGTAVNATAAANATAADAEWIADRTFTLHSVSNEADTGSREENALKQNSIFKRSGHRFA